jgi:hypothetical protein
VNASLAGKMKAAHLFATLVIAAGCSSAQPNHPAAPDAEDSIEPTPDAGGSAKADTAPPAPGDDAAIVVPADSAVSAPADSAPPTTNGGAPAMAVETVEVPASGDMVTMKTSLAMGELFLLKAWGTVDLGGQKVDAEYAFGTGMPADEVGGMDVGVDIGMKQIHAMVHRTATPAGPGRMKWQGGYREDHAYYMTVTGEGKALSLKLAKMGTGSGAVSVALIPLSPTPPKLAEPMDMVMVPVTKTMVMSAMSPQSGKLYILQASGFGKVGGGGTGQGDADYMDWQTNGAGANEGEAGADFGIGVDELPGPKMAGALYQPRMRWWGPWRMDHTYYMVFTGTGKPIQFLYFDSGYGDNSPTDKLTVKIFEAP